MTHRVLVVDDEPDIRQLIALILESAGYDVCQASCNQACLAVLEESHVDLIILDVMMPGIDGWETCRQVKGNPATRDIPVVLLTIRNLPIDRVIGTEVVHADAYLTKPFERRELLATVRRLLSYAPTAP